MDLSLIIPCYNEEEVISLFFKETECIISQLKEKQYIQSYEYIFVDDGSRDKTLSLIKSLAQDNKSVYYISFSRNFGKEAAMYAGLKASKGKYVTIMDADLQDPPPSFQRC